MHLVMHEVETGYCATLKLCPNSSCGFTMQVAGVNMDVLKTSMVFEKSWLSTQIDVVAACPKLQGKN